MNFYYKQRGIGSLGWLVIISVVGFCLLCFFRLGPAYIDNRYIVAALKSLGKSGSVHEKAKSEIRKELDSFAMINGVQGDEAKSFKIVRKKNHTLVNSVYERRVHLVANIDVVMTFKNQLNSSKPDQCCEYLETDEK